MLKNQEQVFVPRMDQEGWGRAVGLKRGCPPCPMASGPGTGMAGMGLEDFLSPGGVAWGNAALLSQLRAQLAEAPGQLVAHTTASVQELYLPPGTPGPAGVTVDKLHSQAQEAGVGAQVCRQLGQRG